MLKFVIEVEGTMEDIQVALTLAMNQMQEGLIAGYEETRTGNMIFEIK